MAISLSSGEIIDPLGALTSQKLLRMVFPRAFEEDPLRLLRAVQFSARFGLAIEPQTLSAMKEKRRAHKNSFRRTRKPGTFKAHAG